jgi:hypothetical protein
MIGLVLFGEGEGWLEKEALDTFSCDSMSMT